MQQDRSRDRYSIRCFNNYHRSTVDLQLINSIAYVLSRYRRRYNRGDRDRAVASNDRKQTANRPIERLERDIKYQMSVDIDRMSSL